MARIYRLAIALFTYLNEATELIIRERFSATPAMQRNGRVSSARNCRRCYIRLIMGL